jgi:hypothetical protein
MMLCSIVLSQVDTQEVTASSFGEDLRPHDHVLNELAHQVSTPSLVSEKWLHRPLVEILPHSVQKRRLI